MSFKRKLPAGDVRRVRSNGQNLRGIITNKAGRPVQFESWLERALILRLDRDPDVLDFQSQPERFIFTDEQGKPHSYTPDFKVWRRHGQIEIHEVTISRRRMRPDLQRREAAARQICSERGWSYVVHTEQTLPQPGEFANLLALAGYRPTIYANERVTRTVVELLRTNRNRTLDRLVSQVEQILDLPEQQITGTICHLLWSGRLQTDLEQLLFDQGAILPGIPVWLGTVEVGHGA
jgi:hypothetical protein